MAWKTSSCTNVATRGFAGPNKDSAAGWRAWSTSEGSYIYTPTTLYNGYYRVVVLRFKRPANITNIFESNVTVTIPVKSLVKGSSSITLTASLHTTDPTTVGCGKIDFTINKSTHSFTNVSGSSNLTFTVNASAITDASKYYYIAISTTSLIEVKAASSWKVEFNYKSYTLGGKPSLNIIDNKNNTCTISGTLGKNGTNNTMKSAMLYYTTNGKNPDANESWTLRASLGATSAASFSKTVAIPSGCTKIIAIVYCNYTHNDSNSGNCSAAVKFRYGPMHSEPVTTWTGQEEGKRLTTKAKVSFVWYDPDWTLADNKANYLPKECLNGYRIRMHEWKKGESSAASIHIGVNSDDSRWYDTWETGETANTLAYGAEYARSGNMNTCTVDPVKLGMVAGDKISIMVHGRYETAGNPVFVWSNVIGSNAESVANSSPWAMFENEGIVNVKVDGEWKEGQVYVKANNEWKEAESVFTKVDGAWKESQ
jgi:hypothetical protein